MKKLLTPKQKQRRRFNSQVWLFNDDASHTQASDNLSVDAGEDASNLLNRPGQKRLVETI